MRVRPPQPLLFFLIGVAASQFIRRVFQTSPRQTINTFFLEKAQRVSKVGSWHWNIKTDEVTWSPELFEIFERSSKDFDGTYKTYLNYLLPKDRKKVQQAIERALTEKKSFNFEHSLITPSGMKKHLFCLGDLMKDAKGEPEFVIGTAQDITEQKRLELQLSDAKKQAEEASSAKTQFLANMSHEIRTPIGIIAGYSELLLNNQIEESAQRAYVKTIQRNALLLAELVDQILSLSKIESKVIEIDESVIDLEEWLSQTRELVLPQAKSAGLRINFELRADTPTGISTDSTRLRQIFMNVVNNAIKFTKSGSIDVLTSLKVEDGKVRLQTDFCDTGMGIPANKKEKIFEAFDQAKPSVSRKFGGTGLGLTISKSFARALGGDLFVLRSQLGKGTVFRLSIPVNLATPKEDDAPSSAHPASKLEGKRVLVVEDSIDNRTLLSTFLSSAGAVVETAENGKIGIEKINSKNYDVVIMDIQMPIMDGLVATALLRKSGNTIPIIALTANAIAEEKDRYIEVGFDDYMTKPVSLQNLLKHVENVA